MSPQSSVSAQLSEDQHSNLWTHELGFFSAVGTRAGDYSSVSFSIAEGLQSKERMCWHHHHIHTHVHAYIERSAVKSFQLWNMWAYSMLSHAPSLIQHYLAQIWLSQDQVCVPREWVSPQTWGTKHQVLSGLQATCVLVVWGCAEVTGKCLNTYKRG